MTLHRPAAAPDPRPSVLEDPSELLAQARLCLHRAPTDCLILAGHGGSRFAPVITSSSLQDLLAPEGGDRLRKHLELLHGRGMTQVRALVVLGDGFQEILSGLREEVLSRIGTLLQEVAAELPAEHVELVAVRAAADRTSWEILPLGGAGSPGAAVAVPRGPLREFSDTRSAAAAVLQGQPMPRTEGPDPVLRRIGRGVRPPVPDLTSRADPEELFTAARTALERLRRMPASTPEEDWMTECEPIGELLSAVAVDRLHWELLARCVEHGHDRSIERERLLQELVSDPRWSPHVDVRAGGSWYRAIEEVRWSADAAWDQTSAADRATVRSAWRALTSLLVLLAWWNHRFATAGGLIDELRDREPDSTLAPLLSRMTDTPIVPAWWPSR